VKPLPPEPATEDSGVDLTLIDAALALSPTERLRRHDAALRTARALQAAFAKLENEHPSRPR
jgi:hypothetical protein